MAILTYDIGGTAIKSGLFEDGKLTVTDTFETQADHGADHVIQKVITHAMQFTSVSSIGISTCGQVDTQQGIIAYANQNMPGYTGMPVVSMIHSALHVPVYIENDVVCAGLGEHSFGNARGCDDFLLVTFGTGIGGTLFLSGRPYNGNGPSRGIMIGGLLNTQVCSDDPWEASYERSASVTRLVQDAAEIDPSIYNGRMILERIDDPLMNACVTAWINRVGDGICSLVHLYNIPKVIVGGGIMENDLVFDAIRIRCHQRLIPGFKGVSIEKASLGNQAGLYGAYTLCSRTI